MIRGLNGVSYMGESWAETAKGGIQTAGNVLTSIFGKSTPPVQAPIQQQQQYQPPPETDWLKTVLIVGAVAGAGYLAYRYIKRRR